MSTEVISDDSRQCPSCGAHTIEFHTVIGEPRHAIARQVTTSGPREGGVFYVAGDCTCCGESFEAINADAAARAEDACPGCGCMPGDEPTPGCDDLEGCGFFAADENGGAL